MTRYDPGMGIKDAWNRQMERSKSFAQYGTHTISLGEYRFIPDGRFKQIRKPLGGAVSEYEAGSSTGGRTTLTRVAAGAIVAGPVGAIVGGLFKKDTSRGYITTTFADGDVVVLDGPLKDEPKMRQFVRAVNTAAEKYNTD